MLEELYTNKINYKSANYRYVKKNIFNLFVKLDKNKKELKTFYSNVLEFIANLENVEDIKIQRVAQLSVVEKLIVEYNDFINKNEEALWEELKEEQRAKNIKFQEELEEKIKFEEKKLEVLDERIKQIINFYNLNFEFFIFYMSENYDLLEGEINSKIKKFEQKDKIIFIFLFFLGQIQDERLTKILINNYNITKGHVSVILENAEIENVLLVLEKHPNKILKFNNIFSVLLLESNKNYLKRIEKIKNPYLTYILKHISSNSKD